MATRTATIVLTARDLASGKIHGLGKTMKAVGAIGAAVGVYQLGQLFVRGITASVKAAAESEEANVALARSLVTSGQAVDELLPKLRARADAMSRVTGVDDDAILKNQALLVSIGKLSGDGLDRATKAALDLAAATGTDLEAAFKLVAKAAAGETSSLKRYGVIIDETTPKNQRFAASLDAIERSFGGAAAAKLETFQGRVDELGVAFGNLQETIGGPMMEVGREFLATFLTPVIRDMDSGTKATDGFRQAIIQLAIDMKPMLAAIEVVAQNVDVFFALPEAMAQIGTQIKQGNFETATAMARAFASAFDTSTDATEAYVKALENLRAQDPAGLAAEVASGAAGGNVATSDLGIDTSSAIVAPLLDVKRQWNLGLQDIFEDQMRQQVALVLAAEKRLLEIRLDQAEEGSDEHLRLRKELLQLEYDEEIRNAELIKADTTAIWKAGIAEREQAQKDHNAFNDAQRAADVDSARQQGLALAQASQDFLRTAFGDSKALAIAQVGIDTAAAVMNIWSHHAWNPAVVAALTGLAIATGAAQAAVIASQDPGFARGGLVEGALGTDVIPARLTRGEIVADTTMDEGRAILGGRAAIVPAGQLGGGVTIVIQGDVLDVDDWMRRNAKHITRATRRGERLRARGR